MSGISANRSVDRRGLSIPDASWPPGKEAPDRLERLRRFVNTANLESGADHLADLDGAAVWLGENGWGAHLLDRARADHLVAVRERLRALLVPLDDHSRALAWSAFVRDAEFGVAIDATGLHLSGAGGADDPITAELAAIAVESELRGDWARLTACANQRCRWVVYDHTKGRSNTWCSMSACGQRSKQRTYRLRQSGSTTRR